MPSYDWLNKTTGETLIVVCTVDTRDTPPDESGEWERIFGAPMVLKASYPDGLRSKSDSNYRDMKEAAKLRVDAANMFAGDSQRAHIESEIKRLESVKK